MKRRNILLTTLLAPLTWLFSRHKSEAKSPATVTTEPILWCMHVAGPDEVHATRTKGDAEVQSKALNDAIAELVVEKDYEDPPLMHASAALWPWSAEAHAKDLARFEAENTEPSIGHGVPQKHKSQS